MPEISVIIPCYNDKEEYLKKCIDSILEQTFSDFEIIIVDDGSTSDCSRFIDGLSKKDERIIVIHQSNQGVSIARNNGVDIAKGRYIVFVDADDIILPYYFENAIRIANDTNADILYGLIYKSDDENYKPDHISKPAIRRIDEAWVKKYTIGYLFGEGRKRFGRGPYARLIKSHIAKTVSFPRGIPLGEDVIWNLQVNSLTKEKFLVEEIWYLYMFREESSSNKFSPNIQERLQPFYNEIGKYITKEKRDIDLYYNRVFLDLSKYIFFAYTGNKNNKRTFIRRWHDFNTICSEEPWSGLGSKDFYSVANKKTKVKIHLFRLRLTFPMWTIKKRSYKKKGII